MRTFGQTAKAIKLKTMEKPNSFQLALKGLFDKKDKMTISLNNDEDIIFCLDLIIQNAVDEIVIYAQDFNDIMFDAKLASAYNNFIEAKKFSIWGKGKIKIVLFKDEGIFPDFLKKHKDHIKVYLTCNEDAQELYKISHGGAFSFLATKSFQNIMIAKWLKNKAECCFNTQKNFIEVLVSGPIDVTFWLIQAANELIKSSGAKILVI